MPLYDIISALKEERVFERTIKLKRNDLLSAAGETDTRVYFIAEGSLSVSVMNEGREQIIRFCRKNDLVTSIDSFFTGEPSDFYIQAIKSSRVESVTKKRFTEFVLSRPGGRELWVKVLEDLVVQQSEREKDLLIPSPAERYSRVLKRSPGLFQEIPHKYIANYLRMSPETLSRLKKS